MTIPDTVTSIGHHAFLGCTNLGEVKIGNGVTTIGEAAFRALPNLTKVAFGTKVNDIQRQAFQDCVNLQNFTLPDTIQYLRYRCFAGCGKALTAVTIPTNKDELETELGKAVFADCTKLEAVTFGDTVKTLTGVGFGGTDPLGAGSNDSKYFDHSYDTGLYAAYYNGLFYNCTSLKTINWGAGIKTIGNIAFLNCSALTDLVLPANITDIGNHAFFGCSSLKTVVVMGKVNSIGRYAFGNCNALHYVDFRGATMTSDPGYMPFAFDRKVVTAYAAEGSTGWAGVAEEPGLPESGTWGGARITYAPPPANADAPYDFYLCTLTDYDWSGPVIITTERYESGGAMPQTVASVREGDPIYLSYTFDEYWRGEAFDVTNRFTLTGAKSGSFDLCKTVDAHGTWIGCWTTNATPALLQNLEPGDYTLTLNLNGDNRLKETDYSNNTTSITFTVVGVPKYTVAFNLNGASGTAPASRTVYEGKTVGELPKVTAPAGWTFLGWYTAASGGEAVEADALVTANMTCFAQWSKCDIGFYTPTDFDWTASLFMTTDYDGTTHMPSIVQGERVYLKYAFRNLAGEFQMRGFINRFTLNTGSTFDDDWSDYSLNGGDFGWGAYAWEVSALQNLAPGTYTLTCTLDATKVLAETDENNNTKTITFTVVAPGPTVHTVTFNANSGSVSPATKTVESGAAVGTLPTPTRSGYTFDGWFTAASGGTKIAPDTKITANVTYYAHWTAVGGGGSGGGDSGGGSGGDGSGYKPDDPIPVTINVGGTTKVIIVIVGQPWGTSLPAAPTAPEGQTFVGWFTGSNGTGTRVTVSTIVGNVPVTLYPYFVEKELYCLYESVYGTPPTAAASEYNGYLYDEKSGAVKGTIQVKVGKPGKKDGKASVKATVVIGTKKVTLKAKDKGKVTIEKNGPTEIELVGGEACEIALGAEGLAGYYGAYLIDGSRNFFASKNKGEVEEANTILSKWLGSFMVIWDGGSLSVGIAAKGKVKVSGTLANGKTKVSVSTVLLVGEEWCCVSVAAQKANLAFVLWLSHDGQTIVAEGLGDNVLVGKAGALANGAVFHVDADEFASVFGQTMLPYLPDGVPVTQKGTKWTLPKAGKVVYKNGAVDESKLGDNPCGLKLTYKPKDGSFKGSFKVYTEVKGKPKATTVNVTGFLLNGIGYGTATIKGKGSVAVTIE